MTNVLVVVVTLSLIWMGYRYHQLGFELALILAGLFLAAVITLALSDD